MIQIQKVRVKLQTLKSGGKIAIGFESGGMDAIAPNNTDSAGDRNHHISIIIRGGGRKHERERSERFSKRRTIARQIRQDEIFYSLCGSVVQLLDLMCICILCSLKY